ncbi:Tudor/PWWP/MBT [Hesseltinella vesiculosa]|uniref:Tudor/PWWP/MBT n=1 Tax=Hesseltinella vesiculosa TaxID=101127 RepID=A0A1X2GP62_9FUNG|nr:Tudor/PWWP/MBT [Hesseltinella vesiculosa]
MGRQDLYPPGTIVFAKLKGYPWWPAKIEDENRVPDRILKQKTKSKAPLWTVFFFGSKDYGFFGPDSIRPFDKKTVETDLKAKKFKNRDLEKAVREALDPNVVQDDDDDEREDDGEDEEEEKVTPVRQGKGKKKKNANSTAASNKANDDVMDTQQLTKKKRANDHVEPVDQKRRRKSVSEESANGKHDPSQRKSDDPNESPEFKRLHHLRHRLQKLMYEKKQGDIPVEDYPKISQLLKDVEESPITYDLLRRTKIGKVVKCGCSYEFVGDADYNLHDRCQDMMRNWKVLFVDSKKDQSSSA